MITSSGSIVIVGLCVCLAIIVRNPHVDRRVRSGLWGVAAIVVVLVVRIFLAWTVPA